MHAVNSAETEQIAAPQDPTGQRNNRNMVRVSSTNLIATQQSIDAPTKLLPLGPVTLEAHRQNPNDFDKNPAPLTSQLSPDRFSGRNRHGQNEEGANARINNLAHH